MLVRYLSIVLSARFACIEEYFLLPSGALEWALLAELYSHSRMGISLSSNAFKLWLTAFMSFVQCDGARDCSCWNLFLNHSNLFELFYKPKCTYTVIESRVRISLSYSLHILMVFCLPWKRALKYSNASKCVSRWSASLYQVIQALEKAQVTTSYDMFSYYMFVP